MGTVPRQSGEGPRDRPTSSASRGEQRNARVTGRGKPSIPPLAGLAGASKPPNTTAHLQPTIATSSSWAASTWTNPAQSTGDTETSPWSRTIGHSRAASSTPSRQCYGITKPSKRRLHGRATESRNVYCAVHYARACRANIPPRKPPPFSIRLLEREDDDGADAYPPNDDLPPWLLPLSFNQPNLRKRVID